MARRLDTLFYEIRAETGQFERGLKGVGTELDKLGTFIKGKPLIAAGALASSLALVAYQATQMAAAVDKGVKAATASMPSLATRTGELRKEIEALSRVSGRSQVELSEAFSIAAKTGVESFTQLQQVVQTAVSIADATGEDLAGVIGGLDLALDGFGLSATRAKDAGAKLFAVAQGRFGFTELTSAIQPVVPILASAGVSFEVMTAALGNLLDEGKSPKQAAAQLKAMADEGKAGADKIRELAGTLITSADALERLQSASKLSREDAGKLGDILRENLNAELITLGNQILPAAIKGMQGLIGAIQTFNQLRGKTSFFAGQELALPDTVNQLQTFTEQRAKEAAAIYAKIRAAQEDLTRAESAYARLPQGARDLGGTADLEGKKTALKVLRDELNQVSQAAEQAVAKMNDLVNPKKRGAGDGAGAGGDKPGKVSKEAKAAATALDELNLAVAGLSKELASPDLRSEFLKDLGEKVTAFRKSLAGGSPAEQAAGEAAIDQFQRLTIAVKRLGVLEPEVKQARIEMLQLRDASGQTEESVKQLEEDLERTTREGGGLKAFIDEMARLDKMRDLANGLIDVADAVIAIGQATGGLSDEVAQALSGFVGLVDSAQSLGDTVGRFNAIDPVSGLRGATTGEVLSSAAGLGISIAGSIASAFSENPLVREAKDALLRNVEALKENTAGLLGAGSTGTNISESRKAIGSFLDGGLPGLYNGRTRVSIERVNDELATFGVSMDDLRTLAKDLDLDFVELTRATIPQFITMLGQMDESFAKVTQNGLFGAGLNGRLGKTKAGFAFTPANESGADQAGAFIADAIAGDGFSPILRDALAGIDLSQINTPEVQAAVREAIRKIFDRVTANGFSDFEGLGDFTPGAFIDFLGTVLGLVPEIEAVGAPAKTAAELVSDFFGSLGRSFRVFDTSAADQTTQVIDGLAKFSPAIAGIVSQGGSIEQVTAALQEFYRKLVSGEATLEGTGLTIDMLVDAIDRLQGVSADAAKAAEEAAAEQARAAEQAARDAAQAAKDQARAAQEAADAQERYTEALLRATEAIGDQALRQLQDEFTLFDISDPVEQLRQFAEALKAGSPVFASLIGGANVADPNARNDLLTQLKSFFLANPDGVAGGFFSADTQRSALLDLAQQLKAVSAVDVTGGTNSSFSVDRSITEITGSRIGGLLGSILIVEQQQLAELQAIRSILAPGSLSPLLPPSLPSGSTAIAGGTVVVSIGGIYLGAVSGPEGLPDIATLTVAISQEIARQITLARNGA